MHGQTEHIETYENLTRDYLAEQMKKDPSLIAVTAGTPKIFGFDESLRKQYAKQFIDVGIAEGHAVTLLSGIAKNGGKPVFGVSSSFLQRTYDQISQDLALNHSPVMIRVPGIRTVSRETKLMEQYGGPASYEIVTSGSTVAILALGSLLELGTKVREKLKEDWDIHATLINPRYITGMDMEVLEMLEKEHQLVVTLESGVLDGGFGKK